MTLKKEFSAIITEQAQSEGITEAMLIERWVMLGKLAEENPDMLAGDLSSYLSTGTYPSTAVEDAPLPAGGEIEYESQNVRMMMKVLIYKLNRLAPNNDKSVQAMGLMKRLGMYSITDVLR